MSREYPRDSLQPQGCHFRLDCIDRQPSWGALQSAPQNSIRKPLCCLAGWSSTCARQMLQLLQDLWTFLFAEERMEHGDYVIVCWFISFNIDMFFCAQVCSRIVFHVQEHAYCIKETFFRHRKPYVRGRIAPKTISECCVWLRTLFYIVPPKSRLLFCISLK